MPENKFTKYFYTGGDWRESFATEKPDVFYITEYGQDLVPSQKEITEAEAKKITKTPIPPKNISANRTEDVKKLQEKLNDALIINVHDSFGDVPPQYSGLKRNLRIPNILEAMDDNRYYNGRTLGHWRSNLIADDSDFITIDAPNTDTSKFIYGNQVSKDALKEIQRVAKLRNQDPYDILAHMLIERSGTPLTTDDDYNAHDVVTLQINPKYLVSHGDDLLKNMGIYQSTGIYNPIVVLNAVRKYIADQNKAFAKVKYPTSGPDAVSMRMSFNRDFNPAQKGYESWSGKVKNTYLDMIDSAIRSLKQNMPNLFSNENN